MKENHNSFLRQIVAASSIVLLLGAMVAVAIALQSPDLAKSRVAYASAMANGNSQRGMFSVPTLPGQAAIIPGQNGDEMVQLAPGELPPGMLQPGQGQIPGAALAPEMQADPRLAQAFQKGVVAQEQGDLKTAAAAYREVLRLEPKTLPAHLNLAIVLMQQKESTRAIWHLKQAIEIAPREPQPRAILAQAYIELKQPREAYNQWTQLADLKLADNGQAAFAAGAIAFEQLRNPAQAEPWLRRAHEESKGNDPRAAILLSRVLGERGKHAAAVGVLESAAGKFPKIIELQTALADAHWASGNRAKAIATIRALEKSTPAQANSGQNLAEIRVMLGRALAQDKQFGEAGRTLRAALNGLPANSPAVKPTRELLVQTLTAQAEDAEKRGQVKNALSTWNEVAVLVPDNPFAHLQRGRLLEKQKEERQALAEYNRALKLAPREPAAVMGAAVLEEKTGDSKRALGHWKTLIETRPEYAPAYFNLARLGARQKQFAEQMDYLETQLGKNAERRPAYDAVLEVAKTAGRVELAREWVSAMSKKYPKAAAPRNALIAFDRKNPPAKAEKTAAPAPAKTPAPTPTPTASPTTSPTATPTAKPLPTPTPLARKPDVNEAEDKPQVAVEED